MKVVKNSTLKLSVKDLNKLIKWYAKDTLNLNVKDIEFDINMVNAEDDLFAQQPLVPEFKGVICSIK